MHKYGHLTTGVKINEQSSFVTLVPLGWGVLGECLCLVAKALIVRSLKQVHNFTYVCDFSEGNETTHVLKVTDVLESLCKVKS